MKKNILLMIILLLFCFESFAVAQEDTCLIGISFQTLNNSFYTTMSDSIESYVLARGGKYIVYDAQINLQKQFSDVEDMLQLGCDVIILAPIDTVASAAIANVCAEAGVPLICVNSGINSEDVASTIETDNYLVGVMMAQALISLTDGNANVGMLEYNLNDAGRDRTNGFLDTLETCPDIKIVARQECDTTTETAMPIAEDMIMAHPELNAFFSINDPTAYGIYSAAVGLGVADDIVIVSCDGAKDVLDWIENGRIQASVAQMPWQIGQFAAKTAFDLMAGEPVDAKVLIPPRVLTADNIEYYESDFSKEGFF